MGTIDLVESVADVRNLLTLIFYVVLTALTVYVFQKHGQRTFELIMVSMISCILSWNFCLLEFQSCKQQEHFRSVAQ